MFDILVVVVVVLSTAFAALRGGLRELSTLLSLAIAGGLTLLLMEPALGVTGQAGDFFGTAIVIAALVAVFFIAAHLGFHLGLKKLPLEGRASLIDRIGGGAFGLFRGLVLIGLGYLGYTYYLDEARQPDNVKNAITRPVAAGMANWFESFAPASTNLENALTDNTDGSNDDATANGYEATDRNTLSEIVTTVTTTGESFDPANEIVGTDTVDIEGVDPDTTAEPTIEDILNQDDEQ